MTEPIYSILRDITSYRDGLDLPAIHTAIRNGIARFGGLEKFNQRLDAADDDSAKYKLTADEIKALSIET